MKTRTFHVLSLLVLLALLLAACQPGATPTEAPPAAPPEEKPTEAPVVEEFVCEDALGCVDIAEGEPVHLAYMLPTTGGASVYGESAIGAMEIAIDERDQVSGRDILLTGEDSGCSAEGGQTAAQRVAADPTIVGVIGTTCSSAMTAAMSTISEAGLTIISPSNTSPALTNPDETWMPGYFRTAHNDLIQGRMAAQFAIEELGASTAAAIHDGDPYTQGLAQAFVDAFADLGGEVTAFEAVNKGDTDMRPVLTSIASNPPDVLYFPIFQPEGDFIVAQSVEVPGLENTTLFGADGLTVAPFAPSAGEAALGMYLSGPYLTGPVAADYMDRYEAMHGQLPPGPFGEHAYDGINILMDAIEAVAVVDADGTLHIGRQALRDAVAATSGFDGITGILSCGPKELVAGTTFNGDCATGEALAIFQVDAAWIASEDAYEMGVHPPVVWTPTTGAVAAPEPEVVGTILIGAAVSETGKYATKGKDVRQGYELWVDYVNNELGGINVGGDLYLVEIIYYDDESDADTANNLTEKLISEDGVQFILGPYGSGLTKSTSAITEQHGVIMIEANGASESIFDRGFEYLFAVLSPASYYSKAAMEALASAGVENIVLAFEDNAFSISVKEGVELWADELGIEILLTESYPNGETSAAVFDPIMTKFKAVDPDAYINAGHLNDGIAAATSAASLGFCPGSMFFMASANDPKFASELGDVSEYAGGSTQWQASMSYQGRYLGTPAEYNQRYQDMWGEAPTYQAAESTAAGLALQAALEAAGTTETEAVRQALRDLDIMTFYGAIAFDETGKNTVHAMAAGQIIDGKFTIVWPPEAAETDFVYPNPNCGS